MNRGCDYVLLVWCRHSPEMIKKLEKAGLGYYVHSVNTKQKLGIKCMLSGLIISYVFSYLGNIPLRHLVYRVLKLPSSMQSLVYDFGQLDDKTEKDYAKKIVENYV